MNKFELRRQRLINLIDSVANGKIVLFAEKIEKDPSYVGRMLYSEGKRGRKNIGEDMVDHIEKMLNLPRGWFDQKEGEWPFTSFSVADYLLLNNNDREEIEVLIKLKIDRVKHALKEKKTA